MPGSWVDRVEQLERDYRTARRRLDAAEANRSKIAQWFQTLRSLQAAPVGEDIDTSCADCLVPRDLVITSCTPDVALTWSDANLRWEGLGQDNFASPPMIYHFYCSFDYFGGEGEDEFHLVRRLQSTPGTVFSTVVFTPAYHSCDPFYASRSGSTIEEG